MPPIPHPPRWYAIPVRVLVMTFIGTLLAFAVSLLLGIIRLLIVSALRGTHADMAAAYRRFALPGALVVGGIIFILSLTMEIRHFRHSKTLAAIERVS